MLLASLLISVPASAQDYPAPPDYKNIKKYIKKKDSLFNYTVLKNKFLSGDSLSLEQMRLLYYGTVFQDDYHPYGREDMKQIKILLSKDSLSATDIELIFQQTDTILQKNPVHLNALYFRSIAAYYSNDRTLFQKEQRRLFLLIAAILSSGTGKDMDEPIYVISTDHEYFIMWEVLKVEPVSQRLIHHKKRNLDYFELKAGHPDYKELYFDITPAIEYLKGFLE